MRRFLKLFIAILIIISVIDVQAIALETIQFDEGQVDNGVVGIKVSGLDDIRVKAIVDKNGTKMYYDLVDRDKFTYLPLQLDNGDYKISVLKNISGTSYRNMKSLSLDIDIEEENTVFLNSITMINFNEETKAVKIAKELTEGLDSDKEKVKAIFGYVSTNFKYDREKIDQLPSNYLPNLDEIYEEKKGICYDYSSLLAAMLRSEGIPTKLVTGYSEYTSVYHAWNEIYDKENDCWVTVDVTKAAQYVQAGFCYNIKENKEDYTTKYEY